MLLVGEAVVVMSSPEARMTAFTRAPEGTMALAGVAVESGELGQGTRDEETRRR